VPDAITCWSNSGPPEQGHPCYDGTGGWIYAYDYDAGSAEIKKITGWTAFVSGTGLVNETDGSSEIDPDALRVRLTALSSDGKIYGGSGFGFNFAPGNPVTQPNSASIQSRGGYCITYSSDGIVEWKLGHDEQTYSADCTYEIKLPASATKKTVEATWDEFVLPDWCKTSPPTDKAGVPDKQTVLDQPFAVKIAIPATQATSPNQVEFTLYEFGWKGSGCGGGPNPIIPARADAAGVKFNMAGKVLSLHVSKAASVQIINLQGALVHSQALVVSNNTINLNSLPAGTYLVRVPALGYTSKILVK
jgi:hypothetical protein